MDMDIDSLPHAPPSVEDIIKLAEALAVGEGPKVPVDEWTHDDDLLIAQFLLKSESRADTGHETVHAIRSALAARGKNVDMYAVAIRAFQSPYGYFAEVLRAEGVALPLSFMCSSL